MSRISEISRQYHEALKMSRAQYESLYRERVAAAEAFYRAFFHRLVCNFGRRFRNQRFRAQLQGRIAQETGSQRLCFVAIDGTCRREVFSDLVTFFGGAYGARGELILAGDGHQLVYRRWSLDHDVSMVAWVPVPFARLEEVAPGQGELFLMTEEERLNLASLHIQVMQLAEIFLAYHTIRSSTTDTPHILLMDLSPSSLLASTAQAQQKIGLVGYPYGGRTLTPADVTVAAAHPLSDYLAIPSPKKMDLYRVLVAELRRASEQVLDLYALARSYDLDVTTLERAASFLVDRGVLEPVREGRHRYRPLVRVRDSWTYVRDLFCHLCSRLFLAKEPGALQYEVVDENGLRHRRWMGPEELNFLLGVGLRALIEACWERGILFYGLAKDSTSRYLTRNFLGVCLETGFYPELRNLQVGLLPWTDRIFCEILPLIDETLAAPWCTIEFDSAFMTLHRERVPEDPQATRVAGVRGRIVNQERLFMRSLGQFFLKRDKRTPLMGHVVFLERLLSPLWDWPGKDQGPSEIAIDTPELGRFTVYAWRDRDHVNPGQWVMMYLLSVLTRNHFAEAIGYPDPLHKADWGAKTIGRAVMGTIRSSTRLLAARPLSRTFREIRDSRRN